MTNAAVYARVSTDEQAREGMSLGEQQRLAAERAAADGVRIDGDHVYVDVMSGARDDRPAYQRMLADAATGAFAAVYVWKFDRLGRNAEERLRARRMLAAAGVELLSTTGENADTLSYGIDAVLSQVEREKISDRTRMGLAAVARAGGWKGGEPPFGYRSAGNRSLMVVESEAAIVDRIGDMYLGGAGVTKIAQILNADGLRTRHGKLWTKVQVLGILDNPIYVGLIRFKGETFPGNHEPVRDAETWQRIQAIRSARSTSGTGGRGAEPRRHLLTKGMLRCVCGERMSSRTFLKDRGHGRQYDYYICRGRETGACKRGAIRREAVDGPLLAMFETHVLDVDATIAQIRGEADRQIREAREFAADAGLELARLDDSIGRVRADYLAGEITAAEWKQLAGELAEERSAAVAQLERHQERAAQIAAETARLDAEEEFAARITEIRRLVAGRITESENVAAFRAALTATFERFDLAETADGCIAVPRLRADRRLDVARTPDEMLLPARRVGLCSREATQGAQCLLPDSMLSTLFSPIHLAEIRAREPEAVSPTAGSEKA